MKSPVVAYRDPRMLVLRREPWTAPPVLVDAIARAVLPDSIDAEALHEFFEEHCNGWRGEEEVRTRTIAVSADAFAEAMNISGLSDTKGTLRLGVLAVPGQPKVLVVANEDDTARFAVAQLNMTPAEMALVRLLPTAFFALGDRAPSEVVSPRPALRALPGGGES